MAKSHVNKVGPGPVCKTPTLAPVQFVPLVWHPLQRWHKEQNWPHIITWSCAARHGGELVFVSAIQLECPKFPSVRQAWLSSEGPHWAQSYECVWGDQCAPSWWGFPECVTQIAPATQSFVLLIAHMSPRSCVRGDFKVQTQKKWVATVRAETSVMSLPSYTVDPYLATLGSRILNMFSYSSIFRAVNVLLSVS